jgi:hypothetical protein
MPILPLAAFADAPVDHIVSLGRACETAYNLRRHYGFATAYPFDWWISGTDGVARFIREANADDLYRLSALEPVDDGASIRNARYDIRLHHEFPRDRGAPGRPVIADWAARVAAPRARTAHLARRLFGLADTAGSIVFVRSCRPRDGEAALAALLQALEMRFPRQQVGVVLVNHQGADVAGYPAHRMAVAPPATADWRGDPAAWDAALGALGLRLTPGLHRPARAEDLSAHHAATAAPDPTTRPAPGDIRSPP